MHTDRLSSLRQDSFECSVKSLVVVRDEKVWGMNAAAEWIPELGYVLNRGSSTHRFLVVLFPLRIKKSMYFE